MRSEDIYPLARRLYAEIPARLQRWTGESIDVAERHHLADNLLMACDEASFDVGAEDHHAAVVISEALAGLLTLWSCRYDTLDEEVNDAQAVLVTALGGTVTALGGTVPELGVYQLAVGTPITVAAIAQMIAFVLMVDLEEEPRC
jgi:hypothetical protein